jgi:hypothetical protein
VRTSRGRIAATLVPSAIRPPRLTTAVPRVLGLEHQYTEPRGESQQVIGGPQPSETGADDRHVNIVSINIAGAGGAEGAAGQWSTSGEVGPIHPEVAEHRIIITFMM